MRALTAAVLIAFVVPSIATAAWPVASRSAYISQGYHRGHKAIDIAARKWTRIVPMKSGKVVFAGWRNNCGGYQVWVKHGNGLYSAYYHMARETTRKGKYVTKSRTTLGYVGKTGCASGNHLHFEVWRGYPWRSGSYRINGRSRIDSGTYLPARYR